MIKLSKYIVRNRFISFLLVCLFSNTIFISGQDLYLINDSLGKWGFINETGDIIIEAKYDSALSFHEEFAAIMVGQKWGYINASGDLEIEAKYDEAHSFNEGIAMVFSDSLCGYINKSDSFVINPQYLDGRAFSEGLALVKTNERIWNFIDTKNNVITSNLKFPLIDLDEDFGISYFFNSGILHVQNDKNKHVFYDREGNKLKFKKLNYLGESFSDSIIIFNKEVKTGYLSTRNEIRIRPSYDSGSDFIDGHAWVALIDTSSFRFMYIDKQNKIEHEFEVSFGNYEPNILLIQNLGGGLSRVLLLENWKLRGILYNLEGKSFVSEKDFRLLVEYYEQKYPRSKMDANKLILIKERGIYKYMDINCKIVWRKG